MLESDGNKKQRKHTYKDLRLRKDVSAVDSRDATLNYLYARVLTEGTHEAHLAM